MGRFSGVASALSVVADRIRQQREQKEGLDLLGETEKIKNKYPTDLETAQADYYRARADKAGKTTIVPEGFEIIGYSNDGDPMIRKKEFGDTVTIDNVVYRKNPTTGSLEKVPIAGENNNDEETTNNPWDDVGLLGKVNAAITPWATKTEERLGGLRPGGLLFSPKVKKSLMANREQTLQFNSIAEAEAANLPKGSIIFIQGKKAIVE